MFITSDQIRNIFLDYFKSKNHFIVNSSSLIPKNDDNLLFTNSGMIQFKDYFLGLNKNIDKNFVSIQRCLRVSGKHNDFRNVGYTSFHNTFFEMMGNFSFGLYFKEEAILYAWELLTSKKWFSISKDRLFVTVHKNDIISYNIWINIIKLSKNRIFVLGDSNINSENFWIVDNLGLCGYSTEIFYDLDYKNNIIENNYIFLKNKKRFLEIWNLVFIEFNFDKKNNLNFLSNKCIDTGMGFERIVSVLQNVKSNFDIDIFKNIKFIISDVLNIKIINNNLIIFNVISDHIRSIIYLIFDGIYPSNEYRGYILRKIIRRTLVHIRFLEINNFVLYKIIYIVLKSLNEFNSFNFDLISKIKNIVLNEEEKFFKTLNNVLNLLNFYISKLDLKKRYLSSKIIFLLYDTYGLPLDILIDICNFNNISINLNKFYLKLNLAKKNSNNLCKYINYKKYFIDLNVLNKLSSTDFLGFKKKLLYSKILFIFNKDLCLNKDNFKLNCSIILDKTIFYPKSSGQSGDIGFIIKKDKSCKFIVKKTIKIGNYIIHWGFIEYGFLEVNDTIKCIYDIKCRKMISNNHSCLHILCSVLNNFLGLSFKKYSTKINKDYFILDFYYNKKLNNYDILKIENKINYFIWKSIDKEEKFVKDKNIFNKFNFNFFGKNIIRYVIFNSISNEFCSGMHVNNTSEIGVCIIKKFYNISINIIRIKAITNFNSLIYINKYKFILKNICNILHINSNNLYNFILNLIKKKKYLKKNNKNLLNSYIKNILVNFNKKDILIYKNFNFLIKDNINFDFFNKNILFIILNKLYIKYNLSLIIISTIKNNKKYFILLLNNNILKILGINIINKVKSKILLKKLFIKDFFILENNNFIINVFYNNYVNIIKCSIFNRIYNYIKLKL